MVARTKARAGDLPIVCKTRDVLESGFGVTVDAVLLFNILHGVRPVDLLRLAVNSLYVGGQVLIIHWRYGETPRGPTLDIRPTPDQVIAWAAEADLEPIGEVIDLPPWPYGMRLELVD
jgi:hypothetical protein